jgi:hypothetical protein
MNENYLKSFKGILKPTGNLKEEMHKLKAEEKKLEERNKVALISHKLPLSKSITF